jgi:hypothetical protein
MYGTEFRRFLGGNSLNDTAQWMSFAAITFLTLDQGGLAGVALVQSVPLLYRILGAPWVAALTERWTPRNLVAGVMAALAVVALGGLWRNLYWYAAIMTANAVLHASFAIGYARLLPGIVPERELERAMGWISVLTNAAKLVCAAAGAYLAYHAGTGVFVIVALLHAAACLLFRGLPRDAGCAGSHAPPPAPARRLDLGIGHLSRNHERLLLLVLMMLTSLCLGVEEVVAMPIARDYLRVPEQWLGAYPAMSAGGGILGALLLRRALMTASRHTVRKLGVLVLALSAAGGCVLATPSPVVGFGLKLVEGLLLSLIWLVGQYGVVLSADAALRGRLQALFMACASIMLLAGKAAAGAFAGALTPWGIHAGASAIAGALALLAIALDLVRARARAGAPRRQRWTLPVRIQPKEKHR